jgi:hypothetical protein
MKPSRTDRYPCSLESAALESYYPTGASEGFKNGASLRHRIIRGSRKDGRRAPDRTRAQGSAARPQRRADETRKKVAGADDIVVGDLSSIAETKSVADLVNRLGEFDAVIHNAGIGYREAKLVKTTDGLPQLFAVNTLAPYILTALSPCRSGWCTCPLECTTAPDRFSTTCCGKSAGGTAPRPTPRPNSRTCCWRSRWPGSFPL